MRSYALLIVIFTILSYRLDAQLTPEDQLKGSVVSIISDFGACNGVLINNLSNDNRQLVLSARHCFSDTPDLTSFIFGKDLLTKQPELAKAAWGTTNFRVLAESVDLDFILFEITEPIPDYVLPYFAGWNAEAELPYTSIGIVMVGDSLQINRDFNQPKYVTFKSIEGFGGDPVQNGTIQIEMWEEGFTALGTSGSPVYDQSLLLKGVLSGGQSSPENPVNDFYSRFDLMFDFFPDRNLKSILDLDDTGKLAVEGLQNNFTKYYNHKVTTASTVTASKIEKEVDFGDDTFTLSGIYFPIVSKRASSQLRIEVIQESVLQSLSFDAEFLINGGENYFELSEPLTLTGTFSVTVEADELIDIVLSDGDGVILDNLVNETSSVLMDFLLNSVNMTADQRFNLSVYPNPVSDNLFVHGIEDINEIQFFNSKGVELYPDFTLDFNDNIILNLSTYPNGVYFLISQQWSIKVLLFR